MSFKKILVALDRSPLSRRVFDHALTLIEPAVSQVKIIHCLNLGTYQNFGAILDTGIGLRTQTDLARSEAAEQAKASAEAASWLNSLRAEAEVQGVSADFLIETAGPGPVVCQVAQDWSADVIVVGNGGKRGIKELILGSVSQYIIHHAPCPVLVLPPDNQPVVEFPAADPESS
ncbi:MAG: universal stress protein [Leptolyngbya sp. DLM2.Bin15]|nr:MAG: universal stress protein [Leptolyngbya sp. DLM2.Bin15]